MSAVVNCVYREIYLSQRKSHEFMTSLTAYYIKPHGFEVVYEFANEYLVFNSHTIAVSSKAQTIDDKFTARKSKVSIRRDQQRRPLCFLLFRLETS